MNDGYYFIPVIFLATIITIIYVGCWQLVEREREVRKIMMAKCSPDYSSFECQLYLAEQGKRIYYNGN